MAPRKRSAQTAALPHVAASQDGGSSTAPPVASAVSSQITAISPPSTAPAVAAASNLFDQLDEGENKDHGRAATGGLAARASHSARPIMRSIAVAALLGVTCVVSQLSLSPVYGAVPAARFHSRMVMLGCFAGWAGNMFLWVNMRRIQPPTLLPILTAYVPLVHFFLEPASAILTARWGPLVTELLTLLPLLILTSSCMATFLDGLDMRPIPQTVADSLPGIGSWAVFSLVRSSAASYLAASAGQTVLHTRIVLQLLLTACHAILAPSRLLLLALPALVHTIFFNTHLALPHATASLRADLLARDRFVLLDRRESITGYISVLESLDQGYRLLRCDHSLLGGQWLGVHSKLGVAEPVYAIFVMLEAVRLVKVPEPVADGDATALVIGLGVGTAPSALIAHGIDTTIVEIDPVVYDFALKYFQLPTNHTAVISDAVSYTADLANAVANSSTPGAGRFDYIIHDVFTGGAEPIEMFTLEFLQNLSTLLKPNGVIAINYAGDLLLPLPDIIVRTIRQVFPRCRVFRELDAEEKAKDDGTPIDFTNMVIFCTKATSDHSDQFEFRSAKSADFLGSRIRERFLAPQVEITEESLKHTAQQVTVLRRNNTADMAKWQDASALGHWELMRTVLPDRIWVKW